MNTTSQDSFQREYPQVQMIFNTLSPRPNGCHPANDIVKCFFFSWNRYNKYSDKKDIKLSLSGTFRIGQIKWWIWISVMSCFFVVGENDISNTVTSYTRHGISNQRQLLHLFNRLSRVYQWKYIKRVTGFVTRKIFLYHKIFMFHLIWLNNCMGVLRCRLWNRAEY